MKRKKTEEQYHLTPAQQRRLGALARRFRAWAEDFIALGREVAGRDDVHVFDEADGWIHIMPDTPDGSEDPCDSIVDVSTTALSVPWDSGAW